MTVGTKSLLFGAHQFLIHPVYVALAWRRLYGFPFDPRLWVAFIVHDWGYLGKPNMDGPEGERHVELGAKIMHFLFDDLGWDYAKGRYDQRDGMALEQATWKWNDFSLYHSRHYAKRDGAQPSRLCFADKLAFSYQVKWLYLLGTRLTGELDEYLTNSKYWVEGGLYESAPDRTAALKWYDDLCVWSRKWVYSHIDGRADTVTVVKNFETGATWN